MAESDIELLVAWADEAPGRRVMFHSCEGRQGRIFAVTANPGIGKCPSSVQGKTMAEAAELMAVNLQLTSKP